MKSNKVVRGHFYFEYTTFDTIKCYLGDPLSPESEFIFEFHKDYMHEIISGLSFFNHKPKKGKVK